MKPVNVNSVIELVFARNVNVININVGHNSMASVLECFVSITDYKWKVLNMSDD